jgi:hypothetical protein
VNRDRANHCHRVVNINYPILVRLDKKTYAGLKALSFYAETPMRDIITSALKAYGLEKRLADAKKESVLYAP